MTVSLGAVDIAVLCMALFAAIAIGFWSGRKSVDAESYLLGGRDLPWWAILGSIVATETSTATVLSVPGVGFGDTGMKFLQIAFGYILGRMVVVKVLLPLYFEGRLFTAYQVLDQRFGNATRESASLLFLVTRNLGDGLRLFLAGVVLHTLLGWSFAACVIVMGVITIVYTWFGGLRSVVWNDCIQFVIYMVGGVASVFLITHNIPGGWETVQQFATESGKSQIFSFSFQLSDANNIWAGLIGGAVLTIGTHGTDHMMVQRYLSARSQKDAGRAILLSAFVVLAQFALFLFIGVQLACFYSTTTAAAPEKADEVFAHFVVNFFPQNIGLIGLILAAILSAAMSTLSSSLNASASACLNDFVVPRCTSEPSEAQQLSWSRWLTLIFGLLQIGIGIGASRLNETVVKNALTIAGFAAGLLLGIFLLGVRTKHVRERDALTGAAVGLVTLIVVQFDLPLYDVSIAWPWLALIGSSTTYAVGLLSAALFKPAVTNDQ